MSIKSNTKDFTIWTEDFTLEDLGIDIPAFASACSVDSPYDIAGIVQGGCASGACMPAVSYYQAAQIMAEHGNDVLEYIQENMGELPAPKADESWSGIAVFYLSYAIELWASSVEGQVSEALQELENEAAQ